MSHPIYKLTHRLSLLGIQPQDLIVLVFTFNIGLQVLGALFPGRLRVVFAVIFIVVTFRAWQAVRDKVPDKFFLHLFVWLSEADVYRIRPQTAAIPLVVDPARVRVAAKSPLPRPVPSPRREARA
jgi:hypothetical protein